MHVTITRDDLLNGLSIVSKASSSNSTVTALTGIMLDAFDGDSLRFAATDLQLGIECVMPSVTERTGIIVVPAKLIVDLVKKLPSGDVLLDYANPEQGLLVRPMSSPKAEFFIRTLNAEEFPSFPDLSHTRTVSMTNSTLKNLIKMTVFAASTEETRPFLTGVFTIVEEGYLKMVATDSWRLSYKQHVLGDTEGSGLGSAIIPARAFSELVRILPDNDDIAEVYIDINQACIKSNGIRLMTRLIEGQFPNYKAILPKAQRASLTVGRTALLGAAERASLMVREKISLVRMSNTGESLIITSNAPDVGKGYEEIPIFQEGEEVKVVLDSKYLIEALKVMEGDNVIIRLQGPQQAVCLEEEYDSNFIHLIMPVKVPA